MPATPQNQPLTARKVLITRAARQNPKLAQKLESLGATVLMHPAVEIGPPKDPDSVRECVQKLDQFGALAFLSRNAASCFADAMGEFWGGREQWPKIPPLAAMGSGTSAELYESVGLQAGYLPVESNSQSMAEMLVVVSKLKGWQSPILIVRADRGSDVISETLDSAGVPFRELAIYSSNDVVEATPAIQEQLRNGEIDWVTVTSSAIAKNVARLFSGCLDVVKIVSISPLTTAAAAEAGLSVTAEADKYNVDGVVAAIIKRELESS